MAALVRVFRARGRALGAAAALAAVLAAGLLVPGGRITRVSVAADGTQGNNSSRYPAISADGRNVAFWAFALMNILLVVLAANGLEIGENNRVRLNIDPLVLVAVGVLLHRAMQRLRTPGHSAVLRTGAWQNDACGVGTG